MQQDYEMIGNCCHAFVTRHCHRRHYVYPRVCLSVCPSVRSSQIFLPRRYCMIGMTNLDET